MQDEIVSLLLENTKMEAIHSLEALFALLGILARDLQADYIKHLPAVLTCLANLIDEGRSLTKTGSLGVSATNFDGRSVWQVPSRSRSCCSTCLVLWLRSVSTSRGCSQRICRTCSASAGGCGTTRPPTSAASPPPRLPICCATHRARSFEPPFALPLQVNLSPDSSRCSPS